MLRLTTRLALLLAVFTFAAVGYAQSAVYAALNTSLDSSSTKVGDTVSAKLRSSVKLPDGTKLPQDTVLTGHVTAVKAENPDSIAFVFDKAVNEDGTIDVHVVVRRLDIPPVNSEDTNDDPRDIKKDGPLVSKLRNITLQSASENESAVVVGKGKSLRLEYKTLLGCLISKS